VPPVISKQPGDDLAHASAAARRRRDFRLFWLGGAVNLLGSNSTALVLPILVLAVGGSALEAGSVGTAGAVVEVLVGPVCGVYADRGSRRAMMVSALIVAALAMGGIGFGIAAHAISLPLLFACVAVGGAATAAYSAAASASIRALLPDEGAEQAVGALQAREQAAKLAGPAVGGGLYQIAAWVPFLVDSASYLFAAVCARAIRAELRPERQPTSPAEQQPQAEPAAPARGCAGSSPPGSAGAAGLAGAVLAPLVLRRVRAAVVVVAASWVMAAAVVPIAAHVALWTDALALVSISLLAPSLSIVFQSKMIMMTPDAMQGRVGTALSVLGEGTGALAPLSAGALVDVMRPAPLALGFAAALVVLAVYATASVRALRAAPPADEAATPQPTPVPAEG
jgi:hypothetical protein